MTNALPDKADLTELLQQHLATRGLMAHPLAMVLGKGVLTPEQLLHYCKIRYSAAPLFEHLAARAASLAEKEEALPQLAAVLHRNLCDERGLDYASGLPTGEGSHSDWRTDFLNAIGLPPQARGDFPLYVYTEADNVWVLIGMVLAAEYAIPLEYARLLRSMRHAFPETFAPADPALPVTPAQSVATRYLQDHIEHDAGRHLPELLNAILHDLKTPQSYVGLTEGVRRFAAERAGLYDYIESAFNRPVAA